MSISSALQTGVSGLQANSTMVGSIAENIANANTVGYRRGFAQMVTTTASGGYGTGVLSVAAVNRLDISTAGGLISTNSNTDLAIGGRGFFAVSLNPNETVQTNYMLTRAGSFLPDADGNLANAAGFYLAGYPYNLDGSIGDVDRSSFGDMKTVNIGNIALSAEATTSVSVLGNLPSQMAGLATPGAPFETSTEYYTSLGGGERLSMSWQPNSNGNEWSVTVSDDNGNALGSVDITFNDSGSAAGSPASFTNITSSAVAPSAFSVDPATGVASITVNNGVTPQTISLNFGAPGTFDGVTQFAGDFTQSYDSDGSSVGELVRTEITDDGILYGIFDNGQRRALYEIPAAVVSNPTGMIEMMGNAYGLSSETGAFFAMKANTGSVGSINSGALEASNVDIATEMTDLIQAQRAFSSNAKIVTTVDEMMDETTRLKR